MTHFDDLQPWTNTFYLDGVEVYQEEHEHVPLSIGEGFIDGHQSARRFRVKDIWLSTDNHGRFGLGRHVFLEEVSGTSDDLPGTLAPSYFTTE